MERCQLRRRCTFTANNFSGSRSSVFGKASVGGVEKGPVFPENSSGGASQRGMAREHAERYPDRCDGKIRNVSLSRPNSLEKVIVPKPSKTGILDIGQFFGLRYSKPEEILQKN